MVVVKCKSSFCFLLSFLPFIFRIHCFFLGSYSTGPAQILPLRLPVWFLNIHLNIAISHTLSFFIFALLFANYDCPLFLRITLSYYILLYPNVSSFLEKLAKFNDDIFRFNRVRLNSTNIRFHCWILYICKEQSSVLK